MRGNMYFFSTPGVFVNNGKFYMSRLEMKAAPDGTWSGNIFEIGGESIGFKNLLPKGYFVICASEGGDDQLFFECIANLEVDTLVSSDELVTVHASSEPSITLVPIEGDLSSIARGLAIL